MGFTSYREDIQERISEASSQIAQALRISARRAATPDSKELLLLKQAKKQLADAERYLVRVPPEAGLRVQKILDLEAELRDEKARVTNLEAENKSLASMLVVEEAASKRLKGNIVSYNNENRHGILRLSSPLFSFTGPARAALRKGARVSFRIYLTKRGQFAEDLRILPKPERKKKTNREPAA